MFHRKNRKESTNVTPASPMDTWTAERAFALKKQISISEKLVFR